jgi:DNA-directed RNA polymerase specialized sigma24 family protein
VFEGEPLIEEFSKYVVERISYKEQADALGINRGTLSNQVHSLIRRKKDDLAHLRKFIAA